MSEIKQNEGFQTSDDEIGDIQSLQVPGPSPIGGNKGVAKIGIMKLSQCLKCCVRGIYSVAFAEYIDEKMSVKLTSDKSIVHKSTDSC